MMDDEVQHSVWSSATGQQHNIGDRVDVTGHDYKFTGTLICIFSKRNGQTRVVVENDDGVCLIQTVKSLHNLSAT